MIESLDGIRETVNYGAIKGFKLYDNVDYETYPAHWHTAIEILMPLQSTYEVTCNGTPYLLKEDDLLFINSGVVHGMSALEGERLIFQADHALLQSILYIENSRPSPLPSVMLISKEEDTQLHAKMKELMLSILREYTANSPFSGLFIYSRFIEICALIGRKYSEKAMVFDTSNNKPKEYMEKFMQICTYIQDHCTEDLHLEFMADQAGFSKYHFTRLFKTYTGMSFYRYLNIKRIELAETLLIDPSQQVTQVAMQSGFSNLTSFIRMFRLIRGCTPTEYRNLRENSGETPPGAKTHPNPLP